jgi:hypothetical protein
VPLLPYDQEIGVGGKSPQPNDGGVFIYIGPNTKHQQDCKLLKLLGNLGYSCWCFAIFKNPKHQQDFLMKSIG